MHSSTSELELEPITSRQQPLDADTTSEIGDTTSEIGDTTSEFSVAETSVEDPTLNVTLNDLALSDLDDDRIVVNTPETEKGSTTGELQIEDDAAADLDETFVGISLQQEAEDAELFQETLQGEVFVPGLGEEPDSYEETLPGVPVEQMLKDIGGEDQPTPVAAQTVFAATATVQDSSFGFKWMLAALCVVALIAGSVWYFVTVTPMNRSMPSPLVAEGVEAFVPEDIESLPPLESLKQPVVTGSIQSGIETEGIADSSGDTEMQLDESGVAALEAGESPEAATVVTGETESVAAVEESTSTPTVESTEVAAAEPQEESSAEDAGMIAETLPADIKPEPAAIQISRSKTIDSESQKINEAFAAYQAGNFQEARAGYEAVLQEFPNNRNALLALGAMYMNSGDKDSAAQLYSQVLRVDPRNEIARAQLIALQQQPVNFNSESALKTMLHQNPEKSYLHFTLGNVYASELRWAEAQQSFFKAYQFDSTNPDYALNLAVALDQMGQTETALDYYHVALRLADERPSGFDTSSVMTRVQSLAPITNQQ